MTKTKLSEQEKELERNKREFYRLFQQLTPENKELVRLKIAELKLQEQTGEVSTNG